MINIQYFATAQDIIDAYGSNIPSNVVCIAGNNDSILINSGNNNPHTNKEEQDKTTIVDKIKNQNITVDPTEETIILRHDDKYTGLGTVTITGIQASRLIKYITENGEYHYTPGEGHYYTGIDIQINVQPELQDKEIIPSREEQVIGCDEGKYGLRSVTVRAVTAEIDPDIKAENIRKGVEILGVYGTFTPKVDNITINPTTARQSFVTPEGVDGYDKVFVEAVTSSIDNNIQPENIKQGVSILGVEGTLSGGGTPDYHYMKGTIDRVGLKAIGWTDEDILTYEQNKSPHYTWQNDQYIVNEENKTLYSLDNPDPSSYKDNPNITFVPNKNMGSYFAKPSGFREMKYIKGIPFFDTSNITDASYFFYGCSNLTTIPPLDLSRATDASHLFNNCSSLTTIPPLDLSRATDASHLFAGCNNLTTIPPLIFSSATNVSALFHNCSSLTTIPPLNFSSATNVNNLFALCSKLTTIPPLDFSSATNVKNLFNNCSSLTTIPPLDLSRATDASHLFANCVNLTTVEGIDFSGLTSDLKQLFGYSSNMPKLTRFIVNGKINVSIADDYSIKALTAIDYDSVKSILAAADRTDNTNPKTLTFNRTMTDQNGELAALVTSCTSKGWTITGLTINNTN